MPSREGSGATEDEARAPSQAVRGPAEAELEAAADPLLRTVTDGLLTGQFARGLDMTHDPDVRLPPATEAIATGMGSKRGRRVTSVSRSAEGGPWSRPVRLRPPAGDLWSAPGRGQETRVQGGAQALSPPSASRPLRWPVRARTAITARSPAWAPRWPMPWRSPISAACCTATSSRLTCCWTQSAISGSLTSAWRNSRRGRTYRSRKTWLGPCGTWPPSGSGASRTAVATSTPWARPCTSC